MIQDLLSEWMPGESIKMLDKTSYSSMPYDDMKRISYSLKLMVGVHHFDIHWKLASSSAEILHAIHFLKHCPESIIPVVAVPFMGPTGRKLCEQEQISWMDLSGNANIRASSPSPLLISVSGKPNKFIVRGRKSSVFAPKSSRVIRWLLLHPQQKFTSGTLKETGVDPGHLSRILDQLVRSMYIVRNEKSYELKNPQVLLDDWRDSYDFFKQNEVIQGHIPARSTDELVETLKSQLNKEENIEYAFTGLAAAWQYTQWVNHRLVTVYLRSSRTDQIPKDLNFKPEARGANVWFALPKDEGVFMGKEYPNGVPCVSRFQVYLDLKDQPERTDEAAGSILRTLDLGENNG